MKNPKQNEVCLGCLDISHKCEIVKNPPFAIGKRGMLRCEPPLFRFAKKSYKFCLRQN